MTSPSATALLNDPLATARQAEEQLWDLRSDHPAVRLADRNSAVRNAIAAGHSVEEVATALGLLPSDVHRILTQ